LEKNYKEELHNFHFLPDMIMVMNSKG